MRLAESRKAYHTVIREWGSKTLPSSDDLVVRNKFEVALCNLPEFVDDSLNDVIPETDRCHRILLQCEDFSGNTKLSLFNSRRPNKDYYTSSYLLVGVATSINTLLSFILLIVR